jgi:hypothetical protein
VDLETPRSQPFAERERERERERESKCLDTIYIMDVIVSSIIDTIINFEEFELIHKLIGVQVSMLNGGEVRSP